MMANNRTKRTAFTLVELLIVISIIAVLSLMALAVLANAGNDAKKSATRLTIMKINDLLMDRWEEFESRSLPFRLATNSVNRNPRNAARIRLFTLRELMRLELPDRYTDITNGPIAYDVPIEQASGAITTVSFTVGNNSLNGYYQSRLSAGFTTEFQGAECLYLILSSMQDEFGNGLDSFKDSIGDIDNDGMPEILDSWGTPIEFLRWAPGLSETGSPSTTLTTSPIQSANPSLDPDPFDPIRSDLRLSDFDPPTSTNPRGENDTFRLIPLIYSAGPDRIHDIWRRDEVDEFAFDGNSRLVDYTMPSPEFGLHNDPFWGWGLMSDTIPSVGFRFDVDNDGVENYFDNIDSHFSQNNDEQ